MKPFAALFAVILVAVAASTCRAALLAEITVGIEDEEPADPLEPIPFTLELDHPTLGVRSWSIDVDDFDIGDTFVAPPAMVAELGPMLTHPEVGLASLFGFDEIGWADYLALILDDLTPFPIFGERFAATGGPGLMGYTVTGIEATIEEACRWCYFPDSLDAAWTISIYGQGVPGDYSGNGKVDAADYVLWRELFGRGITNQADYNFWRRNFGRTSASGSAVGGVAAPEPTAIILATLLATMIWLCRLRDDRQNQGGKWKLIAFPAVKRRHQSPLAALAICGGGLNI